MGRKKSQNDGEAKQIPKNRLPVVRMATFDTSREIMLKYPGEPKAMQSFKVALMGKHIHKYQPTGNVEWKNYIRILTLQQLPDGFKPFPAGMPLRVESRFYFQIPASFPKRLRAGIEAGTAIAYHVSKPDLSDNLKKGLNDALNGIVWEDDRLIAIEYGSKEYSKEPRIEVVITPLVYVDPSEMD